MLKAHLSMHTSIQPQVQSQELHDSKWKLALHIATHGCAFKFVIFCSRQKQKFAHPSAL